MQREDFICPFGFFFFFFPGFFFFFFLLLLFFILGGKFTLLFPNSIMAFGGFFVLKAWGMAKSNSGPPGNAKICQNVEKVNELKVPLRKTEFTPRFGLILFFPKPWNHEQQNCVSAHDVTGEIENMKSLVDLDRW